MNFTIPRKHAGSILSVAALTLLLAAPSHSHAQGGRGGGQRGPAPTPRAAAPIDLTGYWVSIVTDYWRVRMVTPVKGDPEAYDIVPLNAEGMRVAKNWDPARDEAAGEQCKAYGAAGIMKMPTRLHITWENDNTLHMDTDAGTQTRLFNFGGAPAQRGQPAWQGYSAALWDTGGARGGQNRTGQLKVVTTNMRPGYYFKHGLPYSGNAVQTEYFLRLPGPNGESLLVVTQVVEDPQYLTRPYFRTWQFKQEPDGSKWSPSPCKTDPPR